MSSSRLIAAVLASSLLGAPALAGATAARPSSTEEVLATAAKAARAGKRNILVLFHASWCRWCRKLEAILAAPGVAEIVAKHYERAELTVYERGEKQAAENEGAEQLLEALAGENAGLPFAAVLDRKSRKPIATSNASGPGTNVGFPSKADEIDHFVGMLRKGAPRMTEAEAETIRAAFPAP